MVVWTPAARQKAGGAQAMQQLVQLGVSGNESGIPEQRRQSASPAGLLGRSELYQSADMETDLDRLTGTNDGYMDQVHQLRDAWGADLVSLWAERDDFCGMAHLLECGPGRRRLQCDCEELRHRVLQLRA